MNSSFSFWQTFSSSFRVLAQELSYFPGLPTPTVKKVEVRRQKRLTPTIPSLVDTCFYIVTWASISSFSCWSSANVTDFLRAAVKYLVSPLGSKQVCPLSHFSSFCDCCTNFVKSSVPYNSDSLNFELVKTENCVCKHTWAQRLHLRHPHWLQWLSPSEWVRHHPRQIPKMSSTFSFWLIHHYFSWLLTTIDKLDVAAPYWYCSVLSLLTLPSKWT